MPFDGPWGEGEGKINEFFVIEPSEYLPGGDLFGSVAERDKSIDDLCLQLFTEFSGVSPDEVVKARWIEYDYELRDTEEDEDDDTKMVAAYEERINEAKVQPGLNFVCIQPDDPIVALYHDGVPLAAFYASYRGVYQAGAHVTENGAKPGEYFASDCFDEPHNTWLERGAGCADIARAFLLGERQY